MDRSDVEWTLTYRHCQVRCVQAMNSIRTCCARLLTFRRYKLFYIAYSQLKGILEVTCRSAFTARWAILSFRSKKFVTLPLSNVSRFSPKTLTTAYPYADQTISSIFRLLPVSSVLTPYVFRLVVEPSSRPLDRFK